MSEANTDMLSTRSTPTAQYIAGGFVLSTVSVSIGTVLGFSAILLPQLEEESIMNAKSDGASWIASVMNLGQLPGSIVLGFLAGSYGRKISLMASSVLLIAGWSLIGFSNGGFSLILFGRILQGFGLMSSVSQIYLAEISDAQRRGIIAGCGPFAVSSGISLVYFLGSVMEWRFVCLVCAAICGLIVIVLPFLPETPNWLVLKGKYAEARKVLVYLRGLSADIETELQGLATTGVQKEVNSQEHKAMLATPEDDRIISEEISEQLEDDKELTSILKAMSEPSAYKPFFLLNALFILQQSCGSFAVIFYAVNVFQDMGVSTNPYIAAIMTGFIRMLGSLLGLFLLARYPRKTLMMTSAILMSLSMLSLGVTVHLKTHLEMEATLKEKVERGNASFIKDMKLNVSSLDDETELYDEESHETLLYCLSVLPLLEIVAYMLSFGFGVGSVPWLLLGELCPVQVKGLTSGFATCMAYATIFIVVKVFPSMVVTIGSSGAYYVFAVICLVTGVFSYFFVPETRGKTLQELHHLYSNEN